MMHNLRDVLQAQEELGEQENGLLHSMFEGTANKFSLRTRDYSISPFTKEFLIFEEKTKRILPVSTLKEDEKDSSSFVVYDLGANRHYSLNSMCSLLSSLFTEIRELEKELRTIGVKGFNKLKEFKTQSGIPLDLGIGDIYLTTGYSVPKQKGFAKGISHVGVQESIISDPEKYLKNIGILKDNI